MNHRALAVPDLFSMFVKYLHWLSIDKKHCHKQEIMYKWSSFITYLTIVILILIVMFWLYAAGLHKAIVLIYYLHRRGC